MITTKSASKLWPVIILAVAILVFNKPANAYETLRQESINYGFANYLGSGIYSAGDQEVQIYQIPLSYQGLDIEDNPFGLKIHTPITFGFYNLET